MSNRNTPLKSATFKTGKNTLTTKLGQKSSLELLEMAQRIESDIISLTNEIKVQLGLAPREQIEDLIEIATKMGVTSGMRITHSIATLNGPLCKFLLTLNNRDRPPTQTTIAEVLNAIGVLSETRFTLNGNSISRCMRMALSRRHRPVSKRRPRIAPLGENQTCLIELGNKIGVKKGMRLFTSRDVCSDKLIPELSKFLTQISDRCRNMTFKEIAEVLNTIGVISASGLKVTDSHVSSFMRKVLGKRRVAVYHKKNYKGPNHYTCRR